MRLVAYLASNHQLVREIHNKPADKRTDMVPFPRHLLVLSVCILVLHVVSGLFEWLRQTEPEPAAPPAAPPTPPDSVEEHRFEMTTTDEKFLAEAKQLELSPLDSCHQRVIARLKSSCEDLSEENLAKLGVVLFNCQAEIEGRRIFPCTEDMSIKDCTSPMDADTWNAYHIVSNRARAVCYATRQQLFRRRAEHTVNALISTATSQLDAMKDLKDGQLELKELTAASLDKLLEGHSSLQLQQGKLHQGQEQMESSLRDNLERLGQEKALIASGQQLVAQLIQGITSRMENVSENLQLQSSDVHESHKMIVQDLGDVRHQAQDIYQKIDNSMSELLLYQDQTSQYYTDLMNKLERMNSTLGAVLDHLDSMQTRVEKRLHIIQGYLGWAGLSLEAMWTCIAHAGYLVLCAVLLTFLRCPGFSRAVLMLVVPLNAVAEVHQQPALDLCSLSLLLLALSLGHWSLSRMWASLQVRGKSIRSPSNTVVPRHSYPPSSTPEKDENFLEKNPWNQESFLSGELCISAVSPPHRNPGLEPRFPSDTGELDQSTPKLVPPAVHPGIQLGEIPLKNLGRVFDAANDSRDFGSDSRSASPTLSLASSSLSGRQLCNGITKTGKACRKRAVLGLVYCRVHEGGHASYVQ